MTVDPFDMSLRELFEKLLAPPVTDSDPWVDPRDCEAPWREVLAAGKRDEIKLHRIGRRYLVRRSELDRWIALPQHAVSTARELSSPDSSSPVAHILERAGYRKAGGA